MSGSPEAHAGQQAPTGAGHYAHAGGATATAHPEQLPHSLRPGPGQWTAVALMLIGFTLAVAAFVAQSIPVGVAGGVIGLVGVIMAKVFHLMEFGH